MDVERGAEGYQSLETRHLVPATLVRVFLISIDSRFVQGITLLALTSSYLTFSWTWLEFDLILSRPGAT